MNFLPSGWKKVISLAPYTNQKRAFDTRLAGIEDFTRAFSSYSYLNDHAIRIGCLDDPTQSKITRKRQRDADKSIEDAISLILGEPLRFWGSSSFFLWVAEDQYRRTGNPIWPWMVFYVYTRAGLPPPQWVWSYFAFPAFLVGRGAAKLLPSSKGATKKSKFKIRALEKALGLVVGRGKPDHFVQFQQVVTDLRLAIKVRNLQPSDTSTRGWLMKACRTVAGEVRITKKRVPETQARSEAVQVWKAFRRWFEDDGSFRVSPISRDPYHSGK